LENNSFTRRMQHFYPGKEIFEIFYNSVEGKQCANVVQYKEQVILDALDKPKELLIKDKTISIRFDYPLTHEVSFEYNKKDGFTRLDLFRCIYEGYIKIYETEKDETGDPGAIEGLYNRKTSKGKFGIWGHYIDELLIEGVVYDSKDKVVELIIGS